MKIIAYQHAMFLIAIVAVLVGSSSAHAQSYNVDIDVPGASINASNGSATVQVDGVGTINSNGAVDIKTPDASVQTNVGATAVDVVVPNATIHATPSSASVFTVTTVDGTKVLVDAKQGLSAVVDAEVGSEDAVRIMSLEGDESVYIKSEEDVAAYSKVVVENAPQVTGVEANAEHVKVSYMHPGKLFGFIDVDMRAEALVSSDGTVSIQLPWYSFLTVHSSSDLETRITQKFATNEVEIAGGAAISPVAQVRVTQSVVEAITADTSVSVQGGDVSIKAGGAIVEITDGGVKVEYK